jgi:diguanylate cyclase (GGDEF)-like protein
MKQRMARAARRARYSLPVGRGLSDEVWQRRHRGIVLLVLAHVPVLFAVALVSGGGWLDGVLASVPVIVLAIAAGWIARSRLLRSGAATLGLVTCSALLVHLANGAIEMHFHFFVVVGVITLYQDWAPFGLAIAFVVLHHGVLGVLYPHDVYDHASAWAHPWLWACLHAAFVLAASCVHVLAWRLNEDQALRDSLTRLPNRVLFADRLRQALNRQQPGDARLSVLFIDLDGFKGVNDTLGHQAGDRLLQEVARRLQDAIREGDTAARFGGDEFAVLLEDCPDPVEVATRILDSIREPVRLDGGVRYIGASVGLVRVQDGENVDGILRDADLAMYVAKAGGRGRVEVFEHAMLEDAVGLAALESDLRDAIAAGGIRPHYQPSVNLETGAIVGMEALARWESTVRGPVPPSVFIPVAEAANLIRDLFLGVLHQACADALNWRTRHPHVTVAVNVSASQLIDGTLCPDVERALRVTGLPADALVLEITESALVKDVDGAARVLTDLKRLGVRLAIDDFGTGYSSLSYLRRFPVDILKIDKSFVDQLPGDGAALARGIVRLGEALNMEVIAEGVEVDTQRGALTRIGCQQAQGFLFARPQSAEDVTRQLDEAVSHASWWDIRPAVPLQRAESTNVTVDHSEPLAERSA